MSLSSTIVQLSELVVKRLDRFTTAESCGKWNKLLRADFQHDATFVRLADSLHGAAIATCFDEHPPTRDGFDLVNCDIVYTCSVTLQFRVHLFTDSLGHSASPAQYRLTRSDPFSDDCTAEYRCGLKDQNGRFWYPRTDSSQGRNDPFPENDEQRALVVRMNMGHGLKIGRRQR